MSMRVSARSYCLFREVPTTAISPADLMAAHQVHEAACRELGLPPRFTQIRWFRETNALEEELAAAGRLGWHTFTHLETVAGRANPLGWHQIWIRADLPRGEMLNTIVHELRHIWQFRTNYPDPQTLVLVYDERERDAEDYANAFLGRYARKG